MIIKKLVLRNFRVFYGTHEINLTPESNPGTQKPVILIGGLNGAGKTSILTAIKYALHGRLAFENIHLTRDYIASISALINRGIDGASRPTEAAVELTFTYNKDGQESEFTVLRTWQHETTDNLALQQNGIALEELNYDQCQGFLNELVPPGIADLFFFDGEKISSLAEDSSGQLLKVAVKRLLGLDVIERLISDLNIYLKRKKSSQLETSDQTKLSIIETEASELGLSVEKLRFSADLMKNRLDLVSADIRKLEATLSAQGGAFALSKSQEKLLIEGLLKEKAVVERNIRSELEGSLVYSLAQNTLTQLLKQLEGESEYKKIETFRDRIEVFLDSLRKNLKSAPQTTQNTVEALMSSELKKIFENTPYTKIILDISDRETGIISHSINNESVQSLERFSQARTRLAEIEHALENSARNIERAPEDQQLLTTFTEIRDLDKKRSDIHKEYIDLLKSIKQAIAKQLECERKLRTLHDNAHSNHGSTTAISNATSTISILNNYAKTLTAARVKKLEDNFTKTYSRLARKDDLKISARINPNTFDVDLVDQDYNVLNRKSLSAGEKQIYAVAILDALAKTSGRQLPVIIDTPLGRLDSIHRQNLVETYFPFASHQVVLLSTDTEIDREYFDRYLSPYVSHSYQIKSDSNSSSTRLLPGYFWAHDGELS